jgi:hypothetical protein
MPGPEEIKSSIDAFVEKSSKRLGEVNRKVILFLNTNESQTKSDRSGKIPSLLTKKLSHTIHCAQSSKRTDSK